MYATHAQGDLSDPLYFDFISTMQWLTISRNILTGPTVFKVRAPSCDGRVAYLCACVRGPSVTAGLLARASLSHGRPPVPRDRGGSALLCVSSSPVSGLTLECGHPADLSSTPSGPSCPSCPSCRAGVLRRRMPGDQCPRRPVPRRAARPQVRRQQVSAVVVVVMMVA